MLAAPLAAAERIKTLYGAAIGEMDGGADVISVAQMGEDGDDAALRLPRSMLTRIIQARLEEIFGEVQMRLQASGYDVAAGRRAVLTGGAWRTLLVSGVMGAFGSSDGWTATKSTPSSVRRSPSSSRRGGMRTSR